MIKFEDIVVRYDNDFLALPEFNLTIEDGEFFTLLGPSGCGKSTALRTLAGFINPTSGRILSKDRDITRAPSNKRGIGMVFQNYALFPSMSVGDNIAYGLKTAKVAKDEISERVAEVAREVNLTPEQLDKGIAALSGGQQQRVAIARALVMRPDILLLDEPLSNLDAKLRQQLRVQLKDLQQQSGITTVYVTHDQEEALSMSDRIAVLNRGMIEQVGRPQDVYSDSATEFVCNFLGDVNRLSSGQVAELNNQGAGLNPEHNHYIRLEKVRFTQNQAELPAGIHVLRGVPEGRSYLGTTSVYTIRALDSAIRVLVQESGHFEWAEGEVYLGIDPQWIRSYAPSTENFGDSGEKK